jgi:hypothetical protein
MEFCEIDPWSSAIPTSIPLPFGCFAAALFVGLEKRAAVESRGQRKT